MYFLIKDDGLFEKYNNIWDKVSSDIKKEFDNKLVYNEKNLKTKINTYGGEATGFHVKESLKQALIMLV